MGEPLLSYPLEETFKKYMKGCSSEIPLVVRTGGFFGRARPVSAIDSQIIDELGLTRNPTILKDLSLSLGRVFGHVYDSRDVTTAAFRNGDFLRLTYEDREKILQPGFPSTRLAASCITVLGGALSANADFSFPLATLRAALEAEYETDTRSSMEVVNGRFTSPVWEMWHGSTVENADRPRHKFYSGILFWDWYENARPGATLALLEYFNGTIVYRQTRTDRDQQLGGSVDGRVDIPMFTAEAGLDGDMRQQSSFALEDFHVLIDTPRPGVATVGWQPLPPLADIVAAVETNTPADLSAPDGQRIDAGQSKIIQADIRSLPAAYCNSASWSVRDNRTAPGASAEIRLNNEPVQTRKNGQIVCRFQLSYTPQGPTAAGDVSLSPYLVSTDQRGGQPLWLKLGSLTLTRSAGPELHRLSQQGPSVYPVAGAVPEASDIVWSIRFQLRNIGVYNNIDNIGLDRLQLECPDGVMTNAASFASAFDGPATGSSRTFVLTVRNNFEGALGTPFDTVQCRVTGDVEYRSPAGTILPRQVPENLILNFPQPRARQPTAPASPA